MPRRKWTRESILETIRELHGRGESLSTRRMAQLGYSGMVTTTYKEGYFGGWRAALRTAGVDVSQASRRQTKWTRERIIQHIQDFYAQGEDLSHSAAKRRHQYLVVVACDPRFFGSWKAAIEAAGLDYERISRHRSWTQRKIIQQIRELYRRGESLSHDAVKQRYGSLVSAASSRRYFGSWEKAIRAAGLSYDRIRKIESWNRRKIIEKIQELDREGQDLNHSSMRRLGYRGMLEAAGRERNFGSWDEALRAAGLSLPKRTPK